GVNGPSIRSRADGGKLPFAPSALVAFAVIGAGTLTVGWVVSWMVTSKDPLVTTVPSSITLQVTVVVPSGNRAVTVMVPCPDVPPGPSHVRPTGLPTLFAALAEYVTLAPVASVASAPIVPGMVR